MLWSVGVRGEHLSERTSLGFFVAMVGVTLYKLVPKGPPQGERDHRRRRYSYSFGRRCLINSWTLLEGITSTKRPYTSCVCIYDISQRCDQKSGLKFSKPPFLFLFKRVVSTGF